MAKKTDDGQDMKSLVLSAESKLREVAPKWLSVERLTRLALAARSRNHALAECTADSFLLFCMRCAETGLEPIGAGGAWPVPFRNKHTGKREVQFIPDWRGLIFLAKKSGQIKHAYGEVVCAKDEIDYEKGADPRLIHKPNLKERGEVIGAYCIVVLPDDSKHIEYMAKDEIEAIRKRSKAKDEGPWVTDWGQMAIKTVVKRALKPFAASPEMQTAIEFDNQAIGIALPEPIEPVAMPVEIPVEPVQEDNIPMDDDSEAHGEDALKPGLIKEIKELEAKLNDADLSKLRKTWHMDDITKADVEMLGDYLAALNDWMK